MSDLIAAFAFRPSPEDLDLLQKLPIDRLPSIAVVVPSYHQANYIRATIESVIVQNYPRLEIFVADGGSQDGTEPILQEYAARYPQLFRFDSRPDGGQANGVNRGIEQTSGEIIAWINSDDTYLPGAFWKVAAFFFFNRQALVVYGRNQYVDQALRPVVDYPVRWSMWHREQMRLMAHFCCPPQPSLFFRRSVIAHLGPPQHETLDYELWLRWLRDIPFHFMDETLSLSRLHDRAITLRANAAMVRKTCEMLHDYYHVLPSSWAFTHEYVRHHGAAWAQREDRRLTRIQKCSAIIWWAWFNLSRSPRTIAAIVLGLIKYLRSMILPL